MTQPQAFDIQEAYNGKALAQVTSLFQSYGVYRNFDAALGNYSLEIAQLPGKYAPPSGCLLIASQNDYPAGCIAYQKINSHSCEMKRLFVLPCFQSMGLGSTLIRSLIDRARAASYLSMRLDTHPSMIAAKQLYLKHGFTEIERYNNNPTPGIRFFEKLLERP